jgi:hypothetical protein
MQAEKDLSGADKKALKYLFMTTLKNKWEKE